jgi:hypothetical protein
MAGVAFAVEGDGVGFATESYAASALYTTLASLSGALWRIRRAKDYFGDDGTEQREAREIDASYGITEEQIVAEAMVKRGDEMLILDRMDINRANASRLLRKAIDRRAETGRIPPEQTGGQT